MSAPRLLTPPGVGAVAVVAFETWPGSLRLLSTSGAECGWPRDGHVLRGRLSLAGRLVDEVLAVGRGQGGELHLHGSPGVVGAVLTAGGGAQVSAVEGPRSWRAVRVWLSNLSGPMAELVHAAQQFLAGAPPAPDLTGRLDRAVERIALGRHLLRPPRIDLVGRPNAGKSTLFNALLGFERALTSPQAGTTRDAVEALWLLHDVPVRLRDRAGVPGAPEGGGADLLVHLIRQGDDPEPGVEDLPAGETTPRLRVVSQIDRGPAPSEAPGLAVSAVSGAGLAALVEALAGALGLPATGPDDLLAPLALQDAEALVRARDRLARRARH